MSITVLSISESTNTETISAVQSAGNLSGVKISVIKADSISSFRLATRSHKYSFSHNLIPKNAVFIIGNQFNRLDNGVGIQRDALDSPLDQKLDEVRQIRWPLAADADIFTASLTSLYYLFDQLSDGQIILIADMTNKIRIAIQTKSQLC